MDGRTGERQRGVGKEQRRTHITENLLVIYYGKNDLRPASVGHLFIPHTTMGGFMLKYQVNIPADFPSAVRWYGNHF